ncbi:DNA primase [Candidatus Methylacidiphilum fumarolicum]|uniref:DNA primase n=2 Tax=Candidatus Methylacidiphilum fumarolicum TaxID=591154 RepID=I0JXE7_METFB|nr:DNA primase [Candidatus Methylacidiphilum fumarolicum]MBW6415306.1 DNA primase [Candidatus Methylacidiphilum fumarolicum]TFE69285.1 DNA primase [Candidatus Methylacidiphilum fumarolicum]TFE72193.1 DNA primase [Candidatus Methylacidiphilum fumarolicum]TFE72334.1 DNA primase [Candidatus Methylacidiphilum fumarolicum]TFE77011.1 DNA primase [Candidatus Methylacidiphilum fumarolicum]
MDTIGFKEFVERVRKANDIVEVVSEYVVLKKAGAKFKSLSPFKKEKTPSFFVDPQKQLFKCFSSGYGGTVFDFIMYYEKLDFLGALKYLAQRAGIAFPSSFRSSEKAEKLSIQQRLWDLHRAVAEYWTKILLEEPEGEVGRAYLKERGINLETARTFGLGYAPALWDGLLRWASEKSGFLELLEPAGLVVRAENSKIYDRFRGRLIFRISDETGKIVGFSGRLIGSDQGPKYLNSPESLIFSKGKILYGLNVAKKAIVESDKAILCEGHIDLIRLHASGFPTAVATQGTALTDHQAALLKRFCSEVIVAYDGDRAGEDAAVRALDILLEEGFEVKVAQLPSGEDPDSLIAKGGRAAFEQILATALPYPSFVLNKASIEYCPQTAVGKSKIAEKMARLIVKINDPIRRHVASLEVAARIGVSVEAFEKKIEQTLLTKRDSQKAVEEERWVENSISPAVSETIWFLIENPEYMPRFKEALPEEALREVPGGELLAKLYRVDAIREQKGTSDFLEMLSQEERKRVVSFLFQLQQEQQGDYSKEEHFLMLKERLSSLWCQHRIEKIRLQIASEKLSSEEISAKLKEIVDLRKKLL